MNKRQKVGVDTGLGVITGFDYAWHDMPIEQLIKWKQRLTKTQLRIIKLARSKNYRKPKDLYKGVAYAAKNVSVHKPTYIPPSIGYNPLVYTISSSGGANALRRNVQRDHLHDRQTESVQASRSVSPQQAARAAEGLGETLADDARTQAQQEVTGSTEMRQGTHLRRQANRVAEDVMQQVLGDVDAAERRDRHAKSLADKAMKEALEEMDEEDHRQSYGEIEDEVKGTQLKLHSFVHWRQGLDRIADKVSRHAVNGILEDLDQEDRIDEFYTPMQQQEEEEEGEGSPIPDEIQRELAQEFDEPGSPTETFDIAPDSDPFNADIVTPGARRGYTVTSWQHEAPPTREYQRPSTIQSAGNYLLYGMQRFAHAGGSIAGLGMRTVIRTVGTEAAATGLSFVFHQLSYQYPQLQPVFEQMGQTMTQIQESTVGIGANVLAMSSFFRNIGGSQSAAEGVLRNVLSRFLSQDSLGGHMAGTIGSMAFGSVIGHGLQAINPAANDKIRGAAKLVTYAMSMYFTAKDMGLNPSNQSYESLLQNSEYVQRLENRLQALEQGQQQQLEAPPPPQQLEAPSEASVDDTQPNLEPSPTTAIGADKINEAVRQMMKQQIPEGQRRRRRDYPVDASLLNDPIGYFQVFDKPHAAQHLQGLRNDPEFLKNAIYDKQSMQKHFQGGRQGDTSTSALRNALAGEPFGGHDIRDDTSASQVVLPGDRNVKELTEGTIPSNYNG